MCLGVCVAVCVYVGVCVCVQGCAASAQLRCVWLRLKNEMLNIRLYKTRLRNSDRDEMEINAPSTPLFYNNLSGAGKR